MSEENEGPKDSVKAPWSDEQVEALNLYQTDSGLHPFTCGSAASCHQEVKVEGHKPFKVSTTLVATKGGWVCPNCDYTQNWAYINMFEIGRRVRKLSASSKK